jgi:2-methylcitrate dehydratase PrpD
MVNGTAAHALDFDDNFDPAKAHASAVLVPAILAIAEEEGMSGFECLDAYICGLQIMGKVGQGLNPTHRDRGWHATSTIGTIGATAACARLLKLSSTQAGHAMAVSTSMAGGFMSQFGTMMKPIHAGLAAKSGVLSASMAKNDITAGMDSFDSITGLNRLMVGPDYETLRDNLTTIQHGQTLYFDINKIGEPLLILENGFRVKRFPNCGSAHRAMDALSILMREHPLKRNEIKNIFVKAPRTHLNNLMYHSPNNPMEAKFSMQYGLANIIISGDCELADFEEDAINRPEVQDLYPLIKLIPQEGSEITSPTSVIIELINGSLMQETISMPLGSKDKPFTDDQYSLKFYNCVKNLLPDKIASETLKNLHNLKSISNIREITSVLGDGAAPVNRKQ